MREYGSFQTKNICMKIRMLIENIFNPFCECDIIILINYIYSRWIIVFLLIIIFICHFEILLEIPRRIASLLLAGDFRYIFFPSPGLVIGTE